MPPTQCTIQVANMHLSPTHSIYTRNIHLPITQQHHNNLPPTYPNAPDTAIMHQSCSPPMPATNRGTS
eukprot:1141572-Pelagomonas_calceolata.AAC.1